MKKISYLSLNLLNDLQRKKYKSINGAVIRKNVNRIFEAKHGIQINNFVHDVLKRGTEWNKH